MLVLEVPTKDTHRKVEMKDIVSNVKRASFAENENVISAAERKFHQRMKRMCNGLNTVASFSQVKNGILVTAANGKFELCRFQFSEILNILEGVTMKTTPIQWQQTAMQYDHLTCKR